MYNKSSNKFLYHKIQNLPTESHNTTQKFSYTYFLSIKGILNSTLCLKTPCTASMKV